MRRRTLAELRGAAAPGAAGEQSAAELAPFARALALLARLPRAPDEWLREYFSPASPAAPVYVARAPGRLDVMGGIADYSGALVLQLPLDRAASVIAQRQPAPRIDIASRRGGQWHRSAMELAPLLQDAPGEPRALAAWFAERPGEQWAAYVVGVVHRVLQRSRLHEHERMSGVRLLVDSDVPEGSGVSSSAALEVASLAAVAACFEVALAAPELAAECQWVENHIVGAPCGIMDQMTSACGERGRLLRLRCQPAAIEGFIDVPRGWRFYGIDSGVRHAVSGADYGTVRTAAFMGYRIIAAAAGLPWQREGARVRVEDTRWHGYLANIPPDEFTQTYEPLLPERMSGREFLERFGGITDDATRVEEARWYPVRASTAHPVHEQQRVDRFAELLPRLDAEPSRAVADELGALMYASHASYSACGLGSERTDRLVALVRAAGPAHGLFGAKITGGGSGGTVAILGTDAAETSLRALAARYHHETGCSGELFSGSGPGAAETGVLRVDDMGTDQQLAVIR